MSIPLAYIGVVLIWSTTPLAIQWSSLDAGFLFGVTARMSLGLIFCFSLLLVLRRGLMWQAAAHRVYISAGVGIFCAMLAGYWSAQYIGSGLLSVIFGLSPLLTTIMNALLFGERQFSFGKISGMLLAFAGLALIFQDQFALGEESWKGILGALVAASMHTISALFVKRSNQQAQLAPFMVTTGGLMYAVPAFLLCWIFTAPALPELSEFSFKSTMSILYLSLFGSVIGFSAYYYLLKNLPAASVALITLIAPVNALIIGYYFNDEPLRDMLVWGAAGVLLGLAVHQWGDAGIRALQLRLCPQRTCP